MYTQAQERPQTVNTITQMQNYKQMQQIQHMQLNSKKYSQQMAQKPSALHLNVQSASYM
jgi:bisphosphoglycerate-dependent phosphoglycerate mutase